MEPWQACLRQDPRGERKARCCWLIMLWVGDGGRRVEAQRASWRWPRTAATARGGHQRGGRLFVLPRASSPAPLCDGAVLPGAVRGECGGPEPYLGARACTLLVHSGWQPGAAVRTGAGQDRGRLRPNLSCLAVGGPRPHVTRATPAVTSPFAQLVGWHDPE
eukprot:scaffold973_cov399-Prasinococcus_capsulatus_cf.AAC.22